MSTEASDLRQAYALQPVRSRPGLYRGNLSPAWNFLLPSGGVLMSIGLSAMRLELARLGIEDHFPTGATATFCSAIAEGELEVQVTILRCGKTATQMRASLRPLSSAADPGDIGLEIVATWALPRDEDGFGDRVFIPPPETAPFDTLERFEAAKVDFPVPPFYGNLDVWRDRGDVWWQKRWEPEQGLLNRWYRYLVPPTDAEGNLDLLAIPPIADTMASAVHQALGSHRPPLILPSLDLTIHFVTPTGIHATDPILVSSEATSLTQGVATGRTTLWQGPRLIATATQTMTLRRIRPRGKNP